MRYLLPICVAAGVLAGCGQAPTPIAAAKALARAESRSLAGATAACRELLAEIFVALDSNRDFSLSRAELTTEPAVTPPGGKWLTFDQGWMVRIDADKDGRISHEEFTTGPNLAEFTAECRKAVAEGFTSLDRNRDGRLKGDELRRVWLDVKGGDIDHDGALDRSEFEDAFLAAMAGMFPLLRQAEDCGQSGPAAPAVEARPQHGAYMGQRMPYGWDAFESEADVTAAIRRLEGTPMWACFEKFYPGAVTVYRALGRRSR